MTCTSCNHDAPHGRRGYGACSQRTWTEWGRAEAEKMDAKMKAEGKAPVVIVRVLETFFALPGASEQCKCVRRKSRKVASTPPAREGGEGCEEKGPSR